MYDEKMTEPVKKKELDRNQQAALDDLLVDAARKANFNRVVLCIRKGARPEAVLMIESMDSFNKKKLPLAHAAFENYDRRIFDFLVKAGMPVDAVNGDGETVLMRAVRNADFSKVEVLLALGADPLVANHRGTTVLSLAYALASTKPDREKIIDALLEKMPDMKESFNINAASVTLDKPLPAVKSISFNDKNTLKKPDEKKP